MYNEKSRHPSIRHYILYSKRFGQPSVRIGRVFASRAGDWGSNHLYIRYLNAVFRAFFS